MSYLNFQQDEGGQKAISLLIKIKQMNSNGDLEVGGK